MPDSRNVESVKALYAAFARGDIPAVLGAMDPAIEWREAEGNPYEPSGSAWIGPDTIMQKLLTRIGAEWDYFRVVPRTFHDAGSVVVVELRYEGKYKSTGKSLDAQACHIISLRDGRITAFQQFVDTAQVQDVLGAR
jgi:ketosteroid isomerase-like protein